MRVESQPSGGCPLISCQIKKNFYSDWSLESNVKKTRRIWEEKQTGANSSLQIQLEFRLGKGGGAWQKVLRERWGVWLGSPPLVPNPSCSPTHTRLAGSGVRHKKGLKRSCGRPKPGRREGGNAQWLFLYLFLLIRQLPSLRSIPTFPSARSLTRHLFPPPPPPTRPLL